MTIIAKRISTDPGAVPVQKKGSKTYQAVAEAVGSLRQYQDVPVRHQRQWITSFLTVMVLVSIIGGLYLNVASRTAIAGREIQRMQREIIDIQGTNADLQTHIAMLLSNESLQARALAAGYVPLQNTDLDYIAVPGFYQPKGITLVTPTPETVDISNTPEYSESLSSWLASQVEAASLPLAQEH
jgi:hypothetical protein